MLISDWSSDVCSSDLASVSPSGSWKDDGGDGGQFILGDRDCLADELIGAAADEHGYWSGAGRRTGAEGWARVRKGQEPLAATVDGVGRQVGAIRHDRDSDAVEVAGFGCLKRSANLRAAGSVEGDRKSVVEGKSVSVRVDLGGRRNIQKKKTD